LEEVTAEDLADLEEAEKSEVKAVKVTQALVVQATVVRQEEAS
jgi:hypothetical protein